MDLLIFASCHLLAKQKHLAHSLMCLKKLKSIKKFRLFQLFAKFAFD